MVTIDATIGENGLFKKAQEIQDYLVNSQTSDEEEINKLLSEIEGSTNSNNAGGEETNKEITVEVQAIPTSSTITINASGSNAQGKIENGTYRYYIRKVEVGSEFSEKNGTGETCIIEELEQDTEYEIKVECEDEEGNIGSKTITVKTLKVTDADIEEGAITFDNLTWNNKQASITIKTNTDYIIEYQINSTNGTWIRGSKISTIANGLHHGDIVNARLTDGTNSGDYTTYNVIDNIVPIINSFTVENVTENSIKVSVNAEDNESGLAESGTYAYYKNGSLVETSESNTCTYTGLTAQTEYELKVIVKDQGGKTSERIVKGTTSKKKSEIEQARDDGTIFDKTTDLKDDEDNTIWIPGGFGIDEESSTNQDEGIVITDKDGNEFVWVPVPDPSTMFVYQTATLSDDVTKTNKYSKLRLREEDEEDLTASIPGDFSTGKLREPDVVTYVDLNPDYMNKLGYNSINEMASGLVKEYTEMANSIEKYYGFYIGRYELSGTKSKPTVQKGTVITLEDWYGYKKLCEEVIQNNSYAKSIMIYGCQWDETMSWLKRTKFAGQEEKVDKDSRSWGNFVDSTGEANIEGAGKIQITGYSKYWSANNIYDLAGNYHEWTQEACDFINRVKRGSYYMNSSPVSIRLQGASDVIDGFVTARVALIVN